jgi:hypothetical protein
MSFVRIPVHRGISDITEFLAMAEKHGAVIAGGYARYCCSPKKDPMSAGDVDFFPKTEASLTGLCADLERVGFTKKHENHVSITYGFDGEDLRWKLKPVPQVIKPVREGKIVTWGTVEEILENFDFTVVRVALERIQRCARCGVSREGHSLNIIDACHEGFLAGHDEWQGIADDDFEEDEKNTHLRLKNIHCPISSTLRCMKYARKGYFLGPAQVLKLFLDWNARGVDYQFRMIELFKSSEMGQITQREIDELEDLLRVD